MSSGVVIFAINSSFDYVKSAEAAAMRVKKYLNLPITLVTNEQVSSPWFDNVVQIEKTAGTVRHYKTVSGDISPVQWFNESRTMAYQLSPYDKTLLIDADYFMFNDSLLQMFDSVVDFACWSNINDVASESTTQVRVSELSIPMQWATVIYFTKSKLAESIFSFMEIVKQNWEYYSMLYSFRSHNFRNDYALSIALQALSGYSTKNFNRLPGKLHTMFTDIEVTSVTDDTVVYSKYGSINKIVNTNIHCMNKHAMEKFYA